MTSPIDDLDSQISEYFQLIERNKYYKNPIDPLLFWKTNHKSPRFENLAKLAKKLLGVPATSVEFKWTHFRSETSNYGCSTI